MNRRHTVVLQKEISPEGQILPNTRWTRTPSASSPLFKHHGQAHSHLLFRRSDVGNHQQAPRATAHRPGAQPPHWSALGVRSPRPQRKSCKAQLSTLPPLPLLSSFLLSGHSRRSRSAVRGLCCSPWKALRGPRQEWSAIQGTPQATLSPRSCSTAGSRFRHPWGSLL